MTNSIIDMIDVNYSITEAGKERVLLNNITHSFKKGTISTISGPSGSGKTTLLYALAGLVDNVKGNIMIDGTTINKMNEKDRNNYRLNNLSMVYQNLNLFSFMNVEENILVPLYLQNKQITAETKSRIVKYLDIMSLGRIQNKDINSLSGGEKQRVAIIRALISDPKIILCDEPTASLDEQNVNVFMNTLVDIKNETNTSFIIVTHDQRVFRFGEDKCYLSNGNIYKISHNDNYDIKISEAI